MANQPEPRDPVEDDIAAALAHPEFRAWLDEELAREERGEPEPTYSTEEVWAYIGDGIADALADPEFVASLDEDEAALERGEPLPTYSTEEVWAHLEEQRRRRSGASS